MPSCVGECETMCLSVLPMNPIYFTNWGIVLFVFLPLQAFSMYKTMSKGNGMVDLLIVC